MTLSHIDILEAQRSHLDRDPIPIIGSWKIVQVRLAASIFFVLVQQKRIK